MKNIRAFLSGTQNEIEEYCDECINHNQIFFFTGGEKNKHLFECNIYSSKDWRFVKEFPKSGLGCSGGIPLGRAFNARMLVHVKKNFSKAKSEKKQ